jgi:D-alanyl-D-alanine carboxypeptidase
MIAFIFSICHPGLTKIFRLAGTADPVAVKFKKKRQTNEISIFRLKLNVLSQYSNMRSGFAILIFNFIFCSGYSQDTVARIDSLMKSLYQPGEPGAVIAIEAHQKPIFKKGYGVTDLASGNPVSANDNFNIGSLTKQFTAFAVLQLYYGGKFSLSDTIGRFFKLNSPLSAITIGQLLNHSSGLPDHYGFTDTNKIKHATDADVLKALQSADSLYFISGTRYRYSNSAYCLLGLLIEKISGISYSSFVEQNIFAPLGISGATVFKLNRPITRRVTGYTKTKNGDFIKSDAEESIFFSTEADGGIYMSMNNYMKWCAAMESGAFSTTPARRRAWQGQTLVDTLHSLWYGCGWFIREQPGYPRSIYHTGFNGGFETVVFMIPALDYRISIFSNRNDLDLEDLITRINGILSIPDNSFIKSGPLESFIHSWPIFAPCKETRLFSTSFKKNLNGRGAALN